MFLCLDAIYVWTQLCHFIKLRANEQFRDINKKNMHSKLYCISKKSKMSDIFLRFVTKLSYISLYLFDYKTATRRVYTAHFMRIPRYGQNFFST